VLQKEGWKEGGREAGGKGGREGARAYLARVKRVLENRAIELPLGSEHVIFICKLHHTLPVPVHVRVQHLPHGLEVILEREEGGEV